MEEIIEELREHAETVPVPLDLPEEDDILNAQELMLISVPADYFEFLMTVSDLVLGNLEPATVADPHSHTYLPDVAAKAWHMGMPRHLIPVCELPRGFYCIDEAGVVFEWTRKEQLTDRSWESIWHWARDVWLAQA